MFAEDKYNDSAPPALAFTQVFDNSDATYKYVGWARSTQADDGSGAVWAVQRTTFSAGNPTKVEWADGDTKCDNIWNNRATLTYK